MSVLTCFSMSELFHWWPVLIVILLVVLIIRRVRGEPLDVKDAAVTPLVLLAIGTHMIIQARPTGVDLAWLTGLSLVGLAFGAARSATTVIERRDGIVVQRYRWTTFALLVGSFLAGAALSRVGQHFGMHAEARPLIFTIGIGLAGEGVITLIRAARRGLEMPWRQVGQDIRERVLDRN